MATVAVRLVLAVHFCFVSQTLSHRWERSHRPSYAGSTGGTWENYVGQIIPPGTPWPAKPGNYSTTPKTTSQIKVDSHLHPQTTSATETGTSATLLPDKETDFNNSLLGPTTEANSSKQALNSSDSSIVLEYKPMRPSFAGSTGGTWEGYVGQKVPSGTPWPENDQQTSSGSRPDTTGTTDQPDTTLGYTTILQSISLNTEQKYEYTKPNIIQPSIVLEYKPNRPSFAGSVGGSSFTVPTSTSTEKPSDTPSLSSSTTTSSPVVLGYKPDRPSFAGSTGGTWESYVGQKVPTGTPWPENQTSSQPNHTDTTTRHNTTSSESNTTLVLEQQSEGFSETDEGNGSINSTTLITFPAEDEDTRPSFLLGNKPSRPSFVGSGSGTWDNLVGQVVLGTSTSSPEKVMNSTTNNVPKPVKPYVYIVLDKDDIKNAISKNNVAALTEIEVKLNTLKAESESGSKDVEDDIKATDKFLTSERCNNESSLKKTSDPIVHIFLNIEGLSEVVRQSSIESTVEDKQKSND